MIVYIEPLQGPIVLFKWMCLTKMHFLLIQFGLYLAIILQAVTFCFEKIR